MKNLTLGIILSAVSASSFAFDIADTKFSAEALVGMADQELSATGFQDTEGDDISLGFRLAAQPHKNVAIEVGYLNVGDADDSYIDGFGDTIKEEVSTDMYTAGVKLMLPLESGLALNARLGMAMWDTEIKASDSSMPGQTLTADDDGTDFYYGIGAQYSFTENLFAGVEYTRFAMEPSFNTSMDIDHDVDNLAASIGWQF